MAQQSQAPQLSLDLAQRHTVNREQILKAVKALTSHRARVNHTDVAQDRKPSLWKDDQEEMKKDSPIILVLSAKKHLGTGSLLLGFKSLGAPRAFAKFPYSRPAKIQIKHPLHTLEASEETRICLITADPPSSRPKAYKAVIASVDFPAELRKKIPKVLGFSRLRAKYKSFESRRQLCAEYDLFLADERIVRLLPHALGKTFYRSAAKRPIPIKLSGQKLHSLKASNEQDRAVAKLANKRRYSEVGGSESVADAAFVAREITKALSSALVHLTNSPSCEVRVAKEGWPAEMITDNVQAVVSEMIKRFVPNGWQNVRGLYIKGQHTAALPIWLAEELWTDSADITIDMPRPSAAREGQAARTEKTMLHSTNETMHRGEKRRKQKATGDRTAEDTSAYHKRPKMNGGRCGEPTERRGRLQSLKKKAILEHTEEI